MNDVPDTFWFSQDRDEPSWDYGTWDIAKTGGAVSATRTALHNAVVAERDATIVKFTAAFVDMRYQREVFKSEVERLRGYIFEIEVYISNAEKHDPVIKKICRDATEGDEL